MDKPPDKVAEESDARPTSSKDMESHDEINSDKEAGSEKTTTLVTPENDVSKSPQVVEVKEEEGKKTDYTAKAENKTSWKHYFVG